MSAVKDLGERYWPPGGVALQMLVHRWGQALTDVGEQARGQFRLSAESYVKTLQAHITVKPASFLHRRPLPGSMDQNQNLDRIAHDLINDAIAPVRGKFACPGNHARMAKHRKISQFGNGFAE